MTPRINEYLLNPIPAKVISSGEQVHIVHLYKIGGGFGLCCEVADGRWTNNYKIDDLEVSDPRFEKMRQLCMANM